MTFDLDGYLGVAVLDGLDKVVGEVVEFGLGEETGIVFAPPNS